MKTAYARVSRSILMATAAFAAPAALAQTAPQDNPQAAGDAASVLDGTEIIVTAQKRSENLQNVPISIQALGTAKLDQLNIASFDDYAKALPSVSFQSFGPGQTQLSFRGITSGGDGLHGGSQPTAALYLDEVPVTTIAGAVDLHVYDIARVEALSGPQGTLFGSSSLAGTLRIIPNKPDTKEFAGRIDLAGNKVGKGTGGGSIESFVNIPLSDRAALRVVGFYQHDGGYIDSIPGSRTFTLGDDNPATNVTVNNAKFVKDNVNKTDTVGGRAALKVDLDDSWTIQPGVTYQHQTTRGSFLFDPRRGDLKVTDFGPGYNRDAWVLATMTINGKIGNWDLTYAGGYFDRRVENKQDYSEYSVAYDQIQGGFYTYFQAADGSFIDPTQQVHNHDDYTKQSHELRLSSPSGERYKLTAGLFYQRQTDRIVADYYINGLSAIPNSPAVPKSGDDLFATRAYRVDRDYAAFIDGSFDILPQLTLAGGVRVFKVNNTFVGFSGFKGDTTKPNCIAVVADDRVCNNFDRVAKQSGETHRVNLTWKIDPDHLVYGTYSTGYRPGGNNRRPNVPPYVADTLDNFELGFKTSWFDRKLRLNGAVFYEKWNNLQYGLAPVGSNGVTNIYNAGNARVYGAEMDFSLRLGGLNLSGSGAFIDAKTTTDFCNFNAAGEPTNCALKGTRLPVQPKFKGNTTARYEFDLGGARSFIQGTLNHQSGTRSYLTDNEARALGETKGFETFDFSMGSKVSGFDISVYIENAFDKRGILSINTACTPTICGAGARYYPIKPQVFGIKLGHDL